MYFRSTYETSRRSFLKRAEKIKSIYETAILLSFEMPSDNKEALYTDVLYIPSEQTNSNLVVIISGTHGIEAYTGSAIQLMILDKFIINSDKKPKISYLFIHSLNPFGQKYYRRVNENNTDLNRNFEILVRRFSPRCYDRNKAYKYFNDFLNPEGKYQYKQFEKFLFYKNAFKYIFKYGLQSFKEAVMRGQHVFPKGIFYGGRLYEQQQEMINKLVKKYILQHPKTHVIDIHTGLGKKGKLHLIGMDVYKEPNIYLGLKKLYTQPKIPKNKKKFYKVQGSLIEYFYDEARRKDKKLYPVVWEFGTNNNHRLFKSLDSLRIIVNENQHYHYGCVDPESYQRQSDEFRNLFFPDDRKWRKKVIEKAYKTFKQVLPRIEQL